MGAVRQDIGKLVKLGLVNSQRDGNRIIFSANREHPLYPDIRSLVLKTGGLGDVLKEALNIEGVELAFVFGSIAAGKEKPGSDLDLMVIGSVGLRKLSAVLYGVSGRIGREINPHAITSGEFLKRLKTREHFIASVMTSPKIWIKGTEDEFKAMGR